MTIAVGFCGNDGIVIAADSQETVSGYTKGYRGKVRTLIFPDTGNVICMAGSGHSDYIDSATEKAVEDLAGLKTLPEISDRLEKNLLNFFDTYLSRWSLYPEIERPVVELLIGVSTRLGAYRLYHYSGTAFHSVDRKAIGAGILLANSLIVQHETRLITAPIAEVASLAVYILSKVKARIDSCGGQTDLVALRKGGDFSFSDQQQIEKMERQMTKIERDSDRALEDKLTAVPINFSWLSEQSKRASQNKKKDTEN